MAKLNYTVKVITFIALLSVKVLRVAAMAGLKFEVLAFRSIKLHFKSKTVMIMTLPTIKLL